MKANLPLTRRGTEKEKGTGVSLLISKEFIEKNRDKLFIDSTPDKGSSFAFKGYKTNPDNTEDFYLYPIQESCTVISLKFKV